MCVLQVDPVSLGNTISADTIDGSIESRVVVSCNNGQKLAVTAEKVIRLATLYVDVVSTRELTGTQISGRRELWPEGGRGIPTAKATTCLGVLDGGVMETERQTREGLMGGAG